MVKVTCDICGEVMETAADPCYCAKCDAVWTSINQRELMEKTVRAERRKQDGKGRRVRKIKEVETFPG